MFFKIYLKIFLAILISTYIKASTIQVAATSITRRPVLAQSSLVFIITRTSTTIDKKPTTITVFEDVEQDIDEPQVTETQKSEPTELPRENESKSLTKTAASMDPTDYSTVLPTRWRPRRRFGVQSDSQAQFKIDYMMLVSLLTFGFIGIILL